MRILVLPAFLEIFTSDVMIASLLQLEVTLVRVLRPIVVSMPVVVFSNVLWVVFTIVTGRVVVAEVIFTLGLEKWYSPCSSPAKLLSSPR